MDYKLGIDVSEHNGRIDWDMVKASGKVDFAILRAGYGQGVIDKQFYYNADACTRVGIPFGVYWFSYATSSSKAELEAHLCLDTVKDYKLDYPIAFDFEDDSIRVCKKAGVNIIGKDFATSLAQNFFSVIKSVGYKTSIYTNPAYLNQYFDITRLRDYDLWLAQWPRNPNPANRPTSQPEMWQYSSTGKIPGISGDVDLNVCYVKYEKEIPKMSVMEQQWAKDAVEKAKSYGISDGTRPEDPATRVEVMTMVDRAIECLSGSFHEIVNTAVANALAKYNNDGK